MILSVQTKSKVRFIQVKVQNPISRALNHKATFFKGKMHLFFVLHIIQYVTQKAFEKFC